MDPSSIEPVNSGVEDAHATPRIDTLSEESSAVEASGSSKKYSLRRTALIVSVIVHVLIAIGLFLWYVPSRTDDTSAQSVPATESNEENAKPSFKPPPPEPAADVGAEEIRDSVKAQIKAASALPEETQRSELAKNLRRLESIADQQSVVETSKTIAEALGIDSQQYANKEPPSEGTLDTNTAQLENVVRTKDESGQWKYEAIMVDAEGRKMTVPMSRSEGESVYQTFETMNQFPMAKGIYQSVVMPMLQKMMEAESLAEKAEQTARQIKSQEAAAKPIVPGDTRNYGDAEDTLSPNEPDGS